MQYLYFIAYLGLKMSMIPAAPSNGDSDGQAEPSPDLYARISRRLCLAADLTR